MTAPDPDLSPANYPADNPPVDLDDITPEPCGCCGRFDWWRNPNCVQTQPPEFVIDDAKPGVLRAPRPDDFARPGVLPRTERRGPALLAHAGRAVTRPRCDWCDDDATTRLSGEGWTDEACDAHAEQWAQGRTRTPIGGDSG
ncbi:MAG: hypothetical protein INR72_19235 [Williamsia herbipolensis]|nr:hypothetical protein [Williamsia herbipolensis]